MMNKERARVEVMMNKERARVEGAGEGERAWIRAPRAAGGADLRVEQEEVDEQEGEDEGQQWINNVFAELVQEQRREDEADRGMQFVQHEG